MIRLTIEGSDGWSYKDPITGITYSPHEMTPAQISHTLRRLAEFENVSFGVVPRIPLDISWDDLPEAPPLEMVRDPQ